MNGIGAHYAKWNKPDTERKKSAWFHLHLEYKKMKYTEAESELSYECSTDTETVYKPIARIHL